MLTRVLEPEVMDHPDDARDYDAMDHGEVNRRFVDDWWRQTQIEPRGLAGEILDLGTGTAQIPIEMCRRNRALRVRAVDLAGSMLERGRANVATAGLDGQILLEAADAKRLPYAPGQFAGVVSNSLLHHLAEPGTALVEAVRVCRPGGWLFFRDLLRPLRDEDCQRLVDLYAARANAHQRQLFGDSLRAALSLDEIRQAVGALGCSETQVQATSDRHWTWVGRLASREAARSA